MIRRISLFFTTFFVFIVVTTTVTAQSKPNMFPDKDSCGAAYRSGNYTTYEPKFFGLKGHEPVDGKSKIAAPLEADACLHSLTTAGKQWIVEHKGFMMRWETNADGSLKEVPYAIDACGNPNDGIFYPSAPQTTATATQPAAPAASQASAPAPAGAPAPMRANYQQQQQPTMQQAPPVPAICQDAVRLTALLKVLDKKTRKKVMADCLGGEQVASSSRRNYEQEVVVVESPYVGLYYPGYSFLVWGWWGGRYCYHGRGYYPGSGGGGFAGGDLGVGGGVSGGPGRTPTTGGGTPSNGGSGTYGSGGNGTSGSSGGSGAGGYGNGSGGYAGGGNGTSGSGGYNVRPVTGTRFGGGQSPAPRPVSSGGGFHPSGGARSSGGSHR